MSKTKRNNISTSKKADIIAFLISHQDLTYTQIADNFDTTMPTVYNIARKYGLQRHHRAFYKHNLNKVCKGCDNLITSNYIYCSPSCRHHKRQEETYVFIPCPICGDNMEYKYSYIAKRMRIYKQYNFFCSIECYRKSRKGRPCNWKYQEELKKLAKNLLDTDLNI